MAVRHATIACGLAVTLLVLSLTNWGGLPWSDLVGVDFPHMMPYKTAPQCLVTAVTALVVSRIRESQSGRLYTIVSLCLAPCLAGLLARPHLASPADPIIVSVVASVLLGASGGCLLIAWGRAALQLDQAPLARVALGSFALHALLYALAYALPGKERVIFLAGITLGSCLLYGLASPAKERCRRSESVQAPSDTVFCCVRVLRTELICVMASVFAFSFIRTSALTGLADKDLVNQASVLLTLACAVALSLWSVMRSRRGGEMHPLDAMRAYRLSFPLLATVALAMPLLSGPFMVGVAALLHAVFFAILALLVVASASCADKRGLSRPVTFGLFACGAFLSVAISTIISYLIYRNSVVDLTTLLICALAIVYVLAMAYVAIQKRGKSEPGGPATPTTPDEAQAEPGVDGLAANYANAHAEGPDGGQGARQSETSGIAASGAALIAQHYELTERESDVLPLLIEGHSLHGIARRLGVSDNTVRTHMRNLYRKLGVHARQEILDLIDTLR